MPTRTDDFAAHIRDQQAKAPSIAETVPYLIACEAIRALTYGTDTVSAADITVILDAVDLIEGLDIVAG